MVDTVTEVKSLEVKKEEIKEVEKKQEIKQEVKKVEIKKERKNLGNEIHVGQKLIKVYLDAALIQINQKENNNILVCARGQNINRAVDIALILTTKYDSFSIVNTLLHNEMLYSDKYKKNVRISGIKITISKLETKVEVKQ